MTRWLGRALGGPVAGPVLGLVMALLAGAVVAVMVHGPALGAANRDVSGDHARDQARSVPRNVPQCTKNHLITKYRPGDSGMSHSYGRIVLRNISVQRCFIRGYGGLSYVGKGNGTQIGAPADRVRARIPTTILKPGDQVRSEISETSAAAYPAKRCRPVEVDGFRVYAPDETRSWYIEHPTTGCANPRIHLLEHKPYRSRLAPK